MRVIKKDKAGNIKEIIDCLKKGGVVALPTDTVYGFFGNAFKKNIVDKIFDIKKRGKHKPIGIFVKDSEMVQRYAVLNEGARKEVERYWPGSVTFIFKKRKTRTFPAGVGTKETIGIRIPNHPLFKKILTEINFPLAQTSANISGEPAFLEAGRIIKEFKNQEPAPDLVLDAGKVPGGVASTVVDLTKEPPEVLRKGKISFNPS